MGDNNEEISLSDVVVAQLTIADQNELIMQLMQQIAKLRVEMQRRHNLPPLGFLLPTLLLMEGLLYTFPLRTWFQLRIRCLLLLKIP